MASFVNAEKIVKDLKAMKNFGYDAISIDGMITGLLNNVVHDVFEVVWCKDCAFMMEKLNGIYCTVWDGFNGSGVDGFCNYGEKKEGV